MYVLGTAGHVDHGKSVLIHALTGIDPDRLREEKERGMTIDLGFAWLTLPSGQDVGIVDVPGHEHFIKNMLAGVGAIDLALLIVAANEGVMPQTREHVAILDLFGVQKGIAVITKKDLVDEELVSIVTMEIEELLAPTALHQSPAVAVSALTGDGISDLLAAIDSALTEVEPRKDISRPRLFVDRVFTIAGSGTVVTGTLVDGSLGVGQEVEVQPQGLRTRLRGLQTHKTRIEKAAPGSRVAANITGVGTTDIERGNVLTSPGWMSATEMFSARVRLLPSAKRPLKHNASVTLHSGSGEAPARVRLLDANELEPGGDAWAQLRLGKPLAIVKGDHFVIRSSRDTLGGGVVVEAHAGRYRRHRAAVFDSLAIKERGTPEEVLTANLEARQPAERKELIRESSLSISEAEKAMRKLLQSGTVIEVGAGEHASLYTQNGWGALRERVCSTLDDYHRKHPSRAGMPRGELASRLKLPAAISAAVIQKLADEGAVAGTGSEVRLPSHSVQLSAEQQARVDSFLDALARNPYSPPGDIMPEPELVNLLVKEGKVVKVSDNVVFATSAYEDMVRQITDHIRQHGKITLGETRDLLNTSRKYAQVLLEFLDQKKVTRRVGDERVLGPAASKQA